MPRKKPDTIPITDHLYAAVICAVRYCLGRHTYMPGLITDWIMATFRGRMPKGDAEIILRDIREYKEHCKHITNTGFGFEEDMRTWNNFELWLEAEINGQRNDAGI